MGVHCRVEGKRFNHHIPHTRIFIDINVISYRAKLALSRALGTVLAALNGRAVRYRVEGKQF